MITPPVNKFSRRPSERTQDTSEGQDSNLSDENESPNKYHRNDPNCKI